MDTISGDVWLREWAKWIRANETKLSDVPSTTQHSHVSNSNAGGLGAWFGLGGGNPVPARQRTLSTASGPNSRAQGGGATHQPLALRVNVHQLFYILLRAEALALPVGPLDVRIPGATRPTSYFSVVNAAREEKRKAAVAAAGHDPDAAADSKSISSVKSSFSLAPSTWWGGLVSASSNSTSNGNLADPDRDLKYIYSALTKIPSLKLLPAPLPPNGRFIQAHEDNCPGPYAVPLDIFKNVHVLELADVDPRTLLGWDRLSMQLRSLTVCRSGIEDVTDLLVDKVVDDAQRRRGERVRARRRKVHAPEGSELADLSDEDGDPASKPSQSPDTGGTTAESGLLPSQAAAKAAAQAPLPTDALPSLSWHFLRYLSLAENALTFLPSAPLLALSGLTHLDISSNLLNSVPPALAALPSLTVLNLSTNLLESVLGIYTLIPHIRVLNLSHNRLDSLCGLERLSALRRIDLRHNELYDVGEIGRLADCEKVAEVWVGTGNIGLWEERPDWRVECFVLFEQEGRFGVKIDGEAPGWLERGRIRERVPQSAKWKLAKANAASAEAKEKAKAAQKEEEAAAAAAASIKANKGKARALDDFPEQDEDEAELAGPAAIRAVVPRRTGRASAAARGGSNRNGSSGLSPTRAARSRHRTAPSDDDIDEEGADSESAYEGPFGRSMSPSRRSLLSTGGGRGLSRRRESDASSVGGVAARLLGEKQQQQQPLAQRRRNRRLIDLDHGTAARMPVGTGNGRGMSPAPSPGIGPASSPLLGSAAGATASAPHAASTMSIVSGSGVISPGSLAPPAPVADRALSSASIAVASRRGSVLPDPPADLRSAAITAAATAAAGSGPSSMSRDLSRTSTLSSHQPTLPPISGVLGGDADAIAAESDYSAMSDSEAIKKAVLAGRNDLAASPYVTAGPDGAPTENRPPPAWMSSVGRKSGAGVRLGSQVSGQVLSPTLESSAGEGSTKNGRTTPASAAAAAAAAPLSSPGLASPSLIEDEMERAVQRQRRLSHVPQRPSLGGRKESNASSGVGIPAPPGLAVHTDRLTAAELAAESVLSPASPSSPSSPVPAYQSTTTPRKQRMSTHGRSSSHRPSPSGGGLPGSGGSSHDVASLSRVRPNADQIQSRRSRVSLSMYEPPSPLGGPASPGGGGGGAAATSPIQGSRLLASAGMSPPALPSALGGTAPTVMPTPASGSAAARGGGGGSGGMDASDAFRRRIEALKGEVGDDWLRLMVARNEQEKATATATAAAESSRRGSVASTGTALGVGVAVRTRKGSAATRASRRGVVLGGGAMGVDGGGTGKGHRAAVADVQRGNE
ncbi:hypothetical protein V8E36_009250 [Tilletia maclaganii]